MLGVSSWRSISFVHEARPRTAILPMLGGTVKRSPAAVQWGSRSLRIRFSLNTPSWRFGAILEKVYGDLSLHHRHFFLKNAKKSAPKQRVFPCGARVSGASGHRHFHRHFIGFFGFSAEIAGRAVEENLQKSAQNAGKIPEKRRFSGILEVMTRFELVNDGFADRTPHQSRCP